MPIPGTPPSLIKPPSGLPLPPALPLRAARPRAHRSGARGGRRASRATSWHACSRADTRRRLWARARRRAARPRRRCASRRPAWRPRRERRGRREPADAAGPLVAVATWSSTFRSPAASSSSARSARSGRSTASSFEVARGETLGHRRRDRLRQEHHGEADDAPARGDRGRDPLRRAATSRASKGARAEGGPPRGADDLPGPATPR